MTAVGGISRRREPQMAGYRRRQKEPRPGTKSRALWELLNTGKQISAAEITARFGPQVSPNQRVQSLRDIYSLDVRRIGPGLYQLRGAQ